MKCMTRIVFSLFLAAFLLGCTDDSAAHSTLRKSGFTDIALTGYSPFACGDEDTTSTGFRAKNSQGIEVTGTVCCGLFFKGCTVRF